MRWNKIALALVMLVVLFSVARSQQETFSQYITGLPGATAPLGAGDKLYVLQGGVSKAVTAQNLPAGVPIVVSAAANGWLCDGLDHSAQAQAVINTVATAGGTLFFPACPVALFTGTGSGTNLTVTAVTGTILPGMIVTGSALGFYTHGSALARIESQTSGSTGGAGVYVLNQVIGGSGVALAGVATYRADSQLTVPLTPQSNNNYSTAAPLRLTGPGGGINIFGISPSYTAASSAALLDLRFAGQTSSGIGYVETPGTGYTNGTQTITISGGTCSQQPVYQVVVSGGALVQAQFPAAPTGTQLNLITPGQCTVTPANPAAFTGAGGGTGATVRIEWTNGKLQDLAAHSLEIDHLTVLSSNLNNVDSTPLLYTTFPVTSYHDLQLICTGNSQQDAIVLGGMKATGFLAPPNQNADSGFQGYGSNLQNINITNCRRAVYGRTFFNTTQIHNVIAGSYCSGDRFMEFISAKNPVNGINLSGNYTEGCPTLKYGYVLGRGGTDNSTFINNSIYDINNGLGTYVCDYFVEDSSSGTNFLVPGVGNDTAPTPGPVTCGSAGGTNAFSMISGHMANFFNHGVVTNSFGNAIVGNQLIISGPFTSTNWPPSGWTLAGPISIMNIGIDDNVGIADISTGAYNSGAVGNGDVLVLQKRNAAPIAFNSYANEGVTGTTGTKLAKLTTADPSTVIRTATTDTSGAIGVVVANAGTTGVAYIASVGIASCIFDGASVAGNYVQISATVAGDCHDTGAATYPAANQVIGRSVQGNGGAGTAGRILLQLSR